MVFDEPFVSSLCVNRLKLDLGQAEIDGLERRTRFLARSIKNKLPLLHFLEAAGHEASLSLPPF